MKRVFTAIIGVILFLTAYGQIGDTAVYQNSAEKILASSGKLNIGGYAQLDYNQPFGGEVRRNGMLDVHRLVMLFGYRFNEKTQFVTEIEYEHVSEVYVEQAYLQYSINRFVNFRAGLMLIPMGIINEYHEPPTYNGVERPHIDNVVAPTTWRELGAGFSGNLIDASLRYQAYIVNGFSSYNGSAKIGGKNGLRGGRQKGAESFLSSPNFAAKIEYYGVRGLNLGLSYYHGNTQSSLYSGIKDGDNTAIERADSSVVGIKMLGADARYNLAGFQLRGQYYLNFIDNTEKFNRFTAANGKNNDLGSSQTGWYAELAYDLFRNTQLKSSLLPFIRYEKYNLHQSIANGFTENPSYKNTIISTGLGWKITPQAALKCDVQFVKSEADNSYNKIFNAGVGVMF